jgi:PAN domain
VRIALRILGGAGVVILSFWITLTILRTWMGGFDDNTDRSGSDYRQIQLADDTRPMLCQAECNKDARCVAWVYARPAKDVRPKPVCFLKSGTAGNPQPNECCVSGLAHR